MKEGRKSERLNVFPSVTAVLNFGLLVFWIFCLQLENKKIDTVL
jgi:hypothetical protein